MFSNILLGMNYLLKLFSAQVRVMNFDLLQSAKQNVTKISKPLFFENPPIGAATTTTGITVEGGAGSTTISDNFLNLRRAANRQPGIRARAS